MIWYGDNEFDTYGLRQENLWYDGFLCTLLGMTIDPSPDNLPPHLKRELEETGKYVDSAIVARKEVSVTLSGLITGEFGWY